MSFKVDCTTQNQAAGSLHDLLFKCANEVKGKTGEQVTKLFQGNCYKDWNLGVSGRGKDYVLTLDNPEKVCKWEFTLTPENKTAFKATQSNSSYQHSGTLDEAGLKALDDIEAEELLFKQCQEKVAPPKQGGTQGASDSTKPPEGAKADGTKPPEGAKADGTKPPEGAKADGTKPPEGPKADGPKADGTKPPEDTKPPEGTPVLPTTFSWTRTGGHVMIIAGAFFATRACIAGYKVFNEKNPKSVEAKEEFKVLLVASATSIVSFAAAGYLYSKV